jgi:hypothetical protein
MSTIIIPATASSDCPMSEQSDPFAVGIIPNSFPPSIENEDSQESNPFDQLELSPNKRHALWRRNTVEYWNPWWRQVLNSSKSNDKFGYFSWTKAKRSTVWEHFEQGADIQNGSPKALCKACWKIFAHPELRTGGSSTSTLRRHAEHKKCGGSKTGQGLLSQFGVSGWFSKRNDQTDSMHRPPMQRPFLHLPRQRGESS